MFNKLKVNEESMTVDEDKIRAERLALEENEKWTTWLELIPQIELDPGWRIQVAPPFDNVLVRFYVINPLIIRI